MSKKQLAAHLQRSERWIEMRVAEGMPKGPLNAAGRRLFDPEACEAWLAARQNPGEREPSLAERVERLEREVAELRAVTAEAR